MSTNERSERLASEIRTALGTFNDDNTPVVRLVAELREKFQAFKEITHGSLDRLGVKKHEDQECRIKARLQDLETTLMRLMGAIPLTQKGKPLPEVTDPEELELGAYYELHLRHPRSDAVYNPRIERCDYASGGGAHFADRIWATKANPQAFQRWRIFGPVPTMTELPPEPEPKPVTVALWTCIEHIHSGDRYWVIKTDGMPESNVAGLSPRDGGTEEEEFTITPPSGWAIGPIITDAEQAMAWCRGEHLAKMPPGGVLPSREEQEQMWEEAVASGPVEAPDYDAVDPQALGRCRRVPSVPDQCPCGAHPEVRERCVEGGDGTWWRTYLVCCPMCHRATTWHPKEAEGESAQYRGARADAVAEWNSLKPGEQPIKYEVVGQLPAQQPALDRWECEKMQQALKRLYDTRVKIIAYGWTPAIDQQEVLMDLMTVVLLAHKGKEG